MSARSRSIYLSTAHNFYLWAIYEGHRADDPTSRIRRPRAPRLIPRPISDDDLAYALKVAPARMRAMLCLAAFQVFRCGEIAPLRREDILERRDPPILLVTNGKGGHQAVLPLNPKTSTALRCAGLPAKGIVFRNDEGRPYPSASVSKLGGLYLRSVGIDASMHQLRHWFGTAVWSATKDMRVTQELLRHASPHTTAGYAAFDKELATRAVSELHRPRG